MAIMDTHTPPQQRAISGGRVDQPPWCRLPQPGAHWVWLSIAMYGAACLLPAMPPIFGSEPVSGWACLASLIYTLPAWWANPAYFISLFLYWLRRPRAALVFAGLAAVLACSFELIGFPDKGWAESLGRQEIGCYVWIAGLQIHACNLLWQEWRKWRQS